MQERSDSASTGTSPLSSDDEIITKSANESQNLAVLPLFISSDGDDKKGNNLLSFLIINWFVRWMVYRNFVENILSDLQKTFLESISSKNYF